jgi:hypothetical protein
MNWVQIRRTWWPEDWTSTVKSICPENVFSAYYTLGMKGEEGHLHAET